MQLRIPSRRVTKRTRGIAHGSRTKNFGSNSRIFALVLLPRAITLSMNFVPVSPIIAVAHAEEPTPAIATNIVFTPTSPIPVAYEAPTTPTITKGQSRAEAEAAQAAAQAAKAKTAKALVAASTPTVSTTVASEPDLAGKRALVQQIAAAHGIDWKLLESVWQIESGKAWKTSVHSGAGAEGPMQFMPGTWRRYSNGGDITYAPDALNAAASMLAANGAAGGNIQQALFSYNHAQWYVDKVETIMASI